MGTDVRDQEKPEAPFAAFCPLYTHAVEVIGRRWTGAILRSMLAGRTRFSEILADVPELSDRLLSQRLKELESEGILVRRVTPTTPVRPHREGPCPRRRDPRGRGLGLALGRAGLSDPHAPLEK